MRGTQFLQLFSMVMVVVVLLTQNASGLDLKGRHDDFRDRYDDVCCAFEREEISGNPKGIQSSPLYTPAVRCPGNGWCIITDQIAIPWTNILPLGAWPSITPNPSKNFTLKFALDILEKQLQNNLISIERSQNAIHQNRDDIVRLNFAIQSEIVINGNVLIPKEVWIDASNQRVKSVIERFFAHSSNVPTITINFPRVPGGFSTYLVLTNGISIDRRSPGATLDQSSPSSIFNYRMHRECKWPSEYIEPRQRHRNDQVLMGSSAMRAGNTLFSSTIIPDVKHARTIEQQTHSILNYIESILDEENMDLVHITQAKIFLSSTEHQYRFNQVWKQRFLPHKVVPSRVMVMDHPMPPTSSNRHEILVTIEVIAYKKPNRIECRDMPDNKHFNSDFYEIMAEPELYSHAVQTSDGTIFTSAMTGSFDVENRGEENQRPIYIGEVEFNPYDPFVQKEFVFPGSDATLEHTQALTNAERVVGRFGAERKDFFWMYNWDTHLSLDFEATQKSLIQFFNTSYINPMPIHSDMGDVTLPFENARYQVEIYAFPSRGKIANAKSALDQNLIVEKANALLGVPVLGPRNYCTEGTTLEGCILRDDPRTSPGYVKL